MSARRMLVTRPGHSASRTATRLAEAGFEPLVLPLSETVALAAQTVPDPAAYDAVAVTSANAIRHASGALLGILQGKRCYAVGPQTGEAAEKAGLCVAGKDAGEALALAAQISAAERPASRILYLCGKVRGTDFEATLAETGCSIEPLEIYDTRDVRYTDDAIGDAIGWNPIWGAVVYSAGGAGRLLALMARPQVEFLFAQTRFFCLSERTAAVFGKAARTIAAQEPNEEGLFRELIGYEGL